MPADNAVPVSADAATRPEEPLFAVMCADGLVVQHESNATAAWYHAERFNNGCHCGGLHSVRRVKAVVHG